VPRHHGHEHGDLPQGGEAGIDMVDTAISSHEHDLRAFAHRVHGRDPAGHGAGHGARSPLLEQIAAYFRDVRKKYAKFEGSLRGVDSRILVAQVPGGMLTNMENQLREQGAPTASTRC
jgi:oxaloacetate decarboxylase alpha subunit